MSMNPRVRALHRLCRLWDAYHRLPTDAPAEVGVAALLAVADHMCGDMRRQGFTRLPGLFLSRQLVLDGDHDVAWADAVILATRATEWGPRPKGRIDG